jgi:tetratricopeptide (TPR) repeat protein
VHLALLLALFAQQAPVAPTAPAAASPVGQPSEAFQRGRLHYDKGEHAQAIAVLRPLLYPKVLLQFEGEIATAHRLLGIAYVYEKRLDLAEEEFRKFLQLRPDYRMDPLLEPQQVVDFFNSVLTQQQTELTELERRRREAEAEEKRRLEALRRGPLVVERRFGRNSYALNFIPFGVGQFQNGHRGKGWFFALTESTLGLVSLGALTTNLALYGFNPRTTCVDNPAPGARAEGKTVRGCPPGSLPDDKADRAALLTQIQVASGILFWGTALWGIIDAVVHFQPEVSLSGQDAPQRTARAHSFELQPMFLSGGRGEPGASLTFRF